MVTRSFAGTFVREYQLLVRLRGPWDPAVLLDVDGDVEALAALTTRLSQGNTTEEERAFFEALRLSGAVFPTARQQTAGSGPHVANEVEFWLEARQVMAAESPLGAHLASLRELYNLIPELRGDPIMNSFSQRDLSDVYERLSGKLLGDT